MVGNPNDPRASNAESYRKGRCSRQRTYPSCHFIVHKQETVAELKDLRNSICTCSGRIDNDKISRAFQRRYKRRNLW
jgi:hypothetical protein